MKKPEKVFFSYLSFVKKHINNPSENVLYLARHIETLRVGLFDILDAIDERQSRLKVLLYSAKEEEISNTLIRELSTLCLHLNIQRAELKFAKNQLMRNIPETTYYALMRETALL